MDLPTQQTLLERFKKRTGLSIACLEEIAYRKKWITTDQLIKTGKEYEKNRIWHLLKKIL